MSFPKLSGSNILLLKRITIIKIILKHLLFLNMQIKHMLECVVIKSFQGSELERMEGLENNKPT